MRIDILSGIDKPLYPGQIIQYKLNLMTGIKTVWVTEITHVVHKKYFVDEQRFAPYAMWHHKHFISEIKGGVEMEDIVDYKMPFWFLGQLIHPFVVQTKIRSHI